MKGKKLIMLLLIATLLMGSIPISVNALDVPVEIEDVEDEDGNAITTGVYGDVIVVKGIGVSSGYQVSVYWDALKEWNGEQGLLNTTDADPDGTFEIWFEVPNATAGNHYIWVEDLKLEDNDVWGPFTVTPDVALSSSSGLNEDDIMVKGYGFSGNEDIVLVLARNPNVPGQTTVNNEDTGEDADGVETEFEFDIEETPIWPGTVIIGSDNASVTEEIRDDDGDGILQSFNTTGGPAIDDNVGTVNYLTGEVELEFTMAPVNGSIEVTYNWLNDVQDVIFVFGDAVDTNAVGFFYEEVEIPEEVDMETRAYVILALDAEGNRGSAEFTIGPVITLDYKEGPTGLIVSVEGRGFMPRGEAGNEGYIPEDGVMIQDEDADEGALQCTILNLEEDPDGAGTAVDGIECDNDGEFDLEFVMPWTWMDGDHVVTVTDESGLFATADFEVTDLPELTLSVGYGISGSKIDVTGTNFVQLSGKSVEFEVWENEFAPKDLSDEGNDKVEDIGTTLKTTKDGTFSGTITMPALDDARYEIVARQPTYGIHANDTFRVTLLVVVLSEEEGASGETITMTGSGFTPDGEVNASIEGEELFTRDASGTGSFSEQFYIPSLEAGEYTIEVWDVEEEILVTLDFEVTMTTYLVLDPAQAPAEYNVTIEGYYFSADGDDTNNDLEFVLYNRTEDGESDEEWNLAVWQGAAGVNAVELNEDGNFTAWFELPDADELSTGVYYINCTDEEDLFAQIMFNVVDETEEVTPKKDVFRIGDVVSFNIRVSFAQDESYITVLDTEGEVYWETEPFNVADDDWITSGVFKVVPSYRQLADGEPMLLDPAAPLGEWEWAWYDDEDDEIQSGTFMVEEAPIPQPILDEINDLNEAVTGLDEQISGVSDDVSSLQSTVNDAIAAANAAEDAANDAKNAINTVTQTANDALTAAQNAEDAAIKAEEAVNSITNLVWGSIVAALIAALAAIVSLLQISRRIAG